MNTTDRPRLAATTDAVTIVSHSESMRRLLDVASRVAPRGTTILVTGETGTGKEVLARHLHAASLRASRSLVAINCAALSPTLLASTLFGHVRGAFTGALTDAKGVFEEAHEGTLFLDEIGELPLDAQASLLRVLECKALIKVGATRETRVDVRLIAATHRDLRAMVKEGRFREDLYYRLNTIILDVPPLRARRCDLAPLVELFLARLREAEQTTACTLGDDALQTLLAYAFPGNVRELRNIVEHGAIMATGTELRRADLPDVVTRPTPAPRDAWISDDYAASMRSAETDILLRALARAGGRQTGAAQLLDMPLRTLKYRLSKLGVTRERSRMEMVAAGEQPRH